MEEPKESTQKFSAKKTRENRKVDEDEHELHRERLVVDTLMEIKPLKVPAECTRDNKKMTRFLE